MSNAMDAPETPHRSHRATLWLWVGILIAGMMAMLALWMPFAFVHSMATNLRSRGGSVVTESAAPAWLPEGADWIEKIGFIRIVTVDLHDVDVTENDVADLIRLRTLRGANLYCHHLQIDQVMELGATPSLEVLSLVDCPGWTDMHTAELRKRNPHLEVIVRGAAFLGIAGSPRLEGCEVTFVGHNSPAQFGGIRISDIVTTIGSTPVRTFEDLVAAVRKFSPDDVVAVDLLRHGERLSVKCRLKAWRVSSVVPNP